MEDGGFRETLERSEEEEEEESQRKNRNSFYQFGFTMSKMSLDTHFVVQTLITLFALVIISKLTVITIYHFSLCLTTTNGYGP